MSTDLLPVLRPHRPAWNKGRIIGQKRPLTLSKGIDLYWSKRPHSAKPITWWLSQRTTASRPF